jgi:aspartyl-tRNA(Asn)/glutamyl-tRNA(Gln) amidotransferase subunit C
MRGILISTTVATTAQPNTVIVVTGVDLAVVVEPGPKDTIPAATISYYKRTYSTLERSRDQYQFSLSESILSRWKRVAKLARIAIGENEINELSAEMDSILSFVGQLAAIHVDDVGPMTSVTPMAMKMREDKVTDGGIADQIIANAPTHEHHFFLVPKVVE